MRNQGYFISGLLLVQGLSLIGMLVAKYEHQHLVVIGILLLINVSCYAGISYTIYKARRPRAKDPIPSCGDCSPTEKRTSR